MNGTVRGINCSINSHCILPLRIRQIPPLFHEAVLSGNVRTKTLFESRNNDFSNLVGHCHPSLLSPISTWVLIVTLQDDESMASTRHCILLMVTHINYELSKAPCRCSHVCYSCAKIVKATWKPFRKHCLHSATTFIYRECVYIELLSAEHYLSFITKIKTSLNIGSYKISKLTFSAAFCLKIYRFYQWSKSKFKFLMCRFLQ